MKLEPNVWYNTNAIETCALKQLCFQNLLKKMWFKCKCVQHLIKYWLNRQLRFKRPVINNEEGGRGCGVALGDKYQILKMF
jgi:hypothetical protein